MAVIYINSTLCAERSNSEDGNTSPFHEWGYRISPNDKFYCHRDNRFEIIFRAYIRGLDINILIKVFLDLLKGYRSIYLVTQPDIMVAIPLIKFLFPKTKIVTWIWTAQEACVYRNILNSCDHIFCLTEGALEQIKDIQLGPKASLQILGACPDYYQQSRMTQEYDVALVGRTGRDPDVAAAAIQQANFSIIMTKVVTSWLDVSLMRGIVNIQEMKTHKQVVNIFCKSRVTWILLKAGETEPSGYTNLVEALLSGTAVIIADSSILPSTVLSLPGVYLYKAGCEKSLIQQTKIALSESERISFRSDIQYAASQILKGDQLSKSIKAQFEN